MRVTQQELIDILDNSDAKTIMIVYEKPVNMNKKGNPFFVKEGRALVPANEVTKRVVDSFGFGMGYSETINKRLKNNGREGNYVAQEVKWAETVVPNKVVRHKTNGTLYLIVYMSEGDYGIERTTEYYVDGQLANEEQMKIIEQFEIKPAPGGVKKQADAGLGEGEQLRYQTIKFNSIIAIVLDNIMYELK